ncbi:oxygen-independent coproporphyrinogen III oxidase [Pseudoroseicyclus aestuarii]|uniref:Coproporphyrinogen-III oxidase n=1 Tax=Pseudoroseicyclus aestuarii TaxID=1795041 RepID=A0A318SQL9_9RHOB|nr:oxygen-independent coproporphyrinogen III oxidase [Pseudoroseicyclus aestuarii]PYE83735.1 oxygen-independent coproporphyrinogen-3 oxidase [Pseudoroseicyclus aestuarii]
MTHDALRAALLTDRVPRYTSYPPANRFSDAVGPERYAQWLGAVHAGAGISLYVHVPFCRRLCWFCACRTQGTQTDAPVDRYLDHLKAEIAQVRAALPRHLRIETLHLGGGTPTLLSPDRIDRMSAMLRGAFALDEGTEVLAEVDPTDCDEARIAALGRLGLRRASIGVQDFEGRVQAAIGRQQGLEQTARTVAALRAIGVRSINFDLLYGLPYQTPASLERTLRAVIDLAPERIALYGYAHVPWMARRQKLIRQSALPDPEARLALAAGAARILTDAGYGPVGIDHFARPEDSMARAAREGRLRRNFQGYTTDEAPVLIGLGPSSISRVPQGYAQNATATSAWLEAVGAGRLATARGHAMTDRQRAIGSVIEQLMCDGAVDLGQSDHAEVAGEVAERALAAMAELPGLADLRGSRLTLGDLRHARLLCSRIDPGFEAVSERFSQAS